MWTCGTVGVWTQTGVICREQQMKLKQTAKAARDPEDTVVESTSSGGYSGDSGATMSVFP